MPPSIGGFKDLVAWQRAMDLIVAVYDVSCLFPTTEKYGLTAQVRRAATSIASNIAEGYGRRTRADYVHFVDVARGSANEVETQLLIAVRLRLVTSEQVGPAMAPVQEVQRITKGLVEALERSENTTVRGC